MAPTSSTSCRPPWYPQVILANASQVPETQGILLPVRPDGACALIQDLHAIAREELIVCLCDRHGHFEKGDLVDRRCRWLFPLAHLVLILTAFLVLFLFY